MAMAAAAADATAALELFVDEAGAGDDTGAVVEGVF